MRRPGCLLAVVMLAGAGLSAGQKPPRQPTPAIVRPLAGSTTIQNFTVTPPTVSFAASDPDTVSFPGSPSTSVTWGTKNGDSALTWILQVGSGGLVFTGSASCSAVPASAVTVTCVSASASGGGGTANCSGGFTLSTTMRQIAFGLEGTGNRTYTVTLSFSLADSWSYVANLSPPCTLSVSYFLNAP